MSTESKESKKWFSTGFTGGGVAKIEKDKGQLKGMVTIRQGEAKGHRMWCDGTMIQQVADSIQSAGDKGLKARFGHPNMCSDALGTFIGRWKNGTVSKVKAPAAYRGGPEVEGDLIECRADLFLSTTAKDSPSGDLFGYVLSMAAKEPDMCGASIVFSRDRLAEEDFLCSNGAAFEWSLYDKGERKEGKTSKREEIPQGARYYVNPSGFKSPDPTNTKNFEHARLKALHAADLVDDPAATDGMFSGATGAALAANVTEWLDTHPEVFEALTKDPSMIEVLERYATELRPFFDRYKANQEKKNMSTEPTPTPETPKPTAASTVAEPTPAPAPAVVPAAPVPDALAVANTQIATLSARITELEKSLKAEQDKSTALLKGEKPLSAGAAPGESLKKNTPATFWG